MQYEDDERMAAAGYRAFCKTLERGRISGIKRPAWLELPEAMRAAWIEAALEILSSRVDKDSLSDYMRVAGKKGGRIGGKRRLQTLTPERRSEIGLAAARKRWGHAASDERKEP